MFIPPNADSAMTAKIVNGQLDNDNLRLLPAIALNKLAIGALPTGITVASANIVDGTIVDADVNGSAAIAISKTTLGTYSTPTTWSPSLFKNDGTTALSGNVRVARWEQIGKRFLASLTTDAMADPAGISIWVSVPVTLKADATYQIVCASGWSFRGGATRDFSYGFVPAGGTGTKLVFRTGADNNWGAASNELQVLISGEVA